MKFVYSFSIWPDETWKWDKHIFKLFGWMQTRIEQEFTHDEFELFRSGISHHGLTVREIERWMCPDVESIL